MRNVLTLVLLGATIGSAAPARAQRSSDPNIGHFYMARQQVQITDDAPMYNDLRTNPQPPGAQQGVGGMPAQRQPLPKAGWQPYSSSIPSLHNSLPTTFNGVPKPVPQPRVTGQSAKAGAYKPKRPAATSAPRPTGPVAVKRYSPYQGYGTPTGMSSPAPTYAANRNAGSSTNVKGSLLHWSRARQH